MLTVISHVHSTHSYDGELSLEQIRAWCSAHGVRAVLMSEHTNGLSQEQGEAAIAAALAASTPDVQFVPGFEVPYRGAHVLCLGVQTYPNVPEGLEMIRFFKAQGALVVLAHPHRNDFEIDDALAALLDGTEVWNSQYDGKYVPRARSLRFLQELRNTRRDLFAFCGLDVHRDAHFGGPVLFVQAQKNDAAEVIDALRARHFSFGKNRGVHVAASGDIVRGSRARIALVSAGLIGLTLGAKYVLAGMRAVKVKPPKKLKRIIRRWI